MSIDFPIFVGSVMNLNNTFMTHKIPGFYECGKKSIPITYSYNERLIEIPFNGSQIDNFFIYEHCHMILDRDVADMITDQFKTGNFIRFYYKNSSTNVKFFESRENQFLTEYNISLPKDFETNPQIKVTSGNPIQVKEAQIVDIIFRLKFEDFPANSQSYENHNISNVFCFVGFSCLFVAVIKCISAANYFKNHDSIPQEELQRRPRSFANTVVVSALGIQVLFALFLVSLTIKYNIFTSQLMYNSLLLGTVVLSLFRGIIALFFGDEVQDPDLLAPSLFLYAFVMIPIRVVNALSNLLGSFRGPKVISSIFQDIVFLLFSSLLARALSFCFNSMRKNRPVPYSKMINHQPMGTLWTLLSYLFDIISAVLLMPATKHIIIDCLVYQNMPKYKFIFISLFLYFSLSFNISVFKTFSKLKKRTDNWLTSHFIDSFRTALFLLVIVIVYLISSKEIHSNQGILFVTCYMIGILLAVMSVGVCGSFTASFVTVYYIFKKLNKPLFNE